MTYGCTCAFLMNCVFGPGRFAPPPLCAQIKVFGKEFDISFFFQGILMKFGGQAQFYIWTKLYIVIQEIFSKTRARVRFILLIFFIFTEPLTITFILQRFWWNFPESLIQCHKIKFWSNFKIGARACWPK